MLWAGFTLIAAAAQTARNAMQRELTAALGTVGATHVRFLFGFPFALVFLACVLTATGSALPSPPPVFWPWVVAGAFTQIAATATMLSVMGQRSFVVAYAYIKTEPVHVALFGLLFLGDKISGLSALAILIATTGVIVISPRAKSGEGGAAINRRRTGIRGVIRAFRDRVSRRDPLATAAQLCCGGNLHCNGRVDNPGRGFVALSGLARAEGSTRDRTRVATLPVCRLHGRFRLRILVSRFCDHDCGQCAHIGPYRGIIRARSDAFHIQAADHAA